MTPLPTPRRVLAARIIAIAADFLEIVAFPFFFEGFASPLNNVLDFVVAGIMIFLLGWHWAFLPTMLAEAVPFVSLVPNWTAAVFLVTRGMGASPPEGTTPALPPAGPPPEKHGP